jgi:hypothetical protein
MGGHVRVETGEPRLWFIGTCCVCRLTYHRAEPGES